MFKTILIPVDFSQKISRFTDLIRKLSPEKVILLNVIDNLELSLYRELFLAMTASHPENAKTSFKNTPIYKKNVKKMEEYKKTLHKKGYKVEGLIEQGVPYKKILSTGKKLHAGLIIIPSYGKRLSLVKDFLSFGGTVNRVVRHTKIPVMVIK
ncbi:MAG: universal stress protein [Spirochaetes bacterium]|nr:universal stress protein [Spirochaetota bacterium]